MKRAKHHEIVLRDITRRNIKKYCYMHGDNPKNYRWRSRTGFPLTIITVKDPKAIECIRSPKDIKHIQFLMDCVPVPTAMLSCGSGTDLRVECESTEFDVGEWKDPIFERYPRFLNKLYERYRAWMEGESTTIE